MRAFRLSMAGVLGTSALALLVLAISLPSSFAQRRNGTSFSQGLKKFTNFAIIDLEHAGDAPKPVYGLPNRESTPLPPVVEDYDDDFELEPLPTARPTRRPIRRRPVARRPSRRNRNRNATTGPVFVIGSAITSPTENFGRIKTGFSRRSKRQASALPVAAPSRPRALTDTARKFQFLNDNFPEALRLQLSKLVQWDPDLRRDIKVNAQGVTCNDVCPTNSVGFGLIGLCSNVYCICDTSEDEDDDDEEGQTPEFGPNRNAVATKRTRRHQIARCPLDQVFDPNRLICDHPAETDLCSDDPPENPNPPKGHDVDDDIPVSTGWKSQEKPSKRTKVVYIGWEAPTASPAGWAPTTVVRQLQPSYGAPAAWSQPQPQPQALYGPPAAPVLPPVQQYGAPAPQYAAPVQQVQGYSTAPQQQYGAPTATVLSAPQQQQYGVPLQQAMQSLSVSQQYGAPASRSLDSYLNAAVQSQQGGYQSQVSQNSIKKKRSH